MPLRSCAIQAHPADVGGDRCTICGRGEETGQVDWICCDSCNNWVHFSCDKRPNLGAFASYATGEGKSYTCPMCKVRPSPIAGAAAEPMETS